MFKYIVAAISLGAISLGAAAIIVRYRYNKNKRERLPNKIKSVEAATKRKIVFLVSEKEKTKSYPPGYVYALKDYDEFYKYYQGIKSEPIDFVVSGFGGAALYADVYANIIYHHHDARTIVPTYAFSAMTIIALSSKCTMMNNTSSLSPIDSQLYYQIDEKNNDAFSVNDILVDTKIRNTYHAFVQQRAKMEKEKNELHMRKYVSCDDNIVNAFCSKYTHNFTFDKQFLTELGIKIHDIPQEILDLFYEVIL